MEEPERPETQRPRMEEPVTEEMVTERPVTEAGRRRMRRRKERQRSHMEAERRWRMEAERRRVEAERQRQMQMQVRRWNMAERRRIEAERSQTDERPRPIEDKRWVMMKERWAERQLMEAERCREAERRRMEAERWRVQAELRRLQPERRGREREIPVRQRMEWERVAMALSRMSRRVEWEAMAEKVEVDREARMEKAELEVEKMKSRRQMPRPRWRQRVEMDEAKMAEAEMTEAEMLAKREAKRAELERERDMDLQRMDAEVAELERLLAEFEMEEAEMEAEKKRVYEGIRIFEIWWDVWLQAQKQEQGEDREWVKTWLLREMRMFCARRPLAVMAVWKAWDLEDEEDEDLYIELYKSISEEKMSELFQNIWKEEGFGRRAFPQELQGVDVRKYTDFRNGWEEKYKHQHGEFEDITKTRCMLYTHGPVFHFIFNGPRPRTLQIFSAKIQGCSNWPLEVYGVIALRDFVDPQRNVIFNLDRNECQIITEEDPYLTLTGPTRSVVLDMNENMGPVTIEAELKVKRAVEFEDRYIILDAISLPTVVGSRSLELAGPDTKVHISVGAIEKTVEATIFIRLTDGTWPNNFHGQFVAKTASIECSEVMLCQFSGDGKMNQSRSVVSVEASGVLIVTLKGWRGEEVGSVVFNATSRGRSSGTLHLGSCSVQILVAWSLTSPYCVELVPLESKKLHNFSSRHQDANESSRK